MPRSKEEVKREIEKLTSQEYKKLPDHEIIGRTFHMKEGDPQFFYPSTKKVIQMVKRGSKDNKLYYVIYGDGEHRYELFIVLAEDSERAIK